MRDNKLHTPDGFRDYLPRDYKFKLDIQSKIESVFNSHGYVPVSSPMLEYMEVFENKGSIPPTQMYRMFDREGDILTLRSDMTPPIARIAATNFSSDDFPLRFRYTENSFRCHESYKGKAGEFTETGVELIGASNVEADAEVIALAVKCLLAAGLSDFRVYIEHPGLISGALTESGLTRSDQTAAMNFLSDRNIAAAGKFLSTKTLGTDLRKLTGRLNSLTGGRALLDEMRGLSLGETAANVLEELARTNEILEDYGLSEYIRFDLGLSGHLDYYTGMVFRGYALGVGFSLLDGGRYDNLLPHYGMNACAVGFAVKIDNLVSILQKEAQPIVCDALIGYSAYVRKFALDAADELRRQGLIIENGLLIGNKTDGLNEHLSLARRKGIPGVIYFEGENSVRICDLVHNTSKTITIAELLRGDAL
ncbi:MAG: ATP phosphoribosyltransferase regulatory subunit [Clostridiales bacterium]|nr:ATP phosphoribosyltransferase regulatory subunit [Clostridiales bacterium]